MRRIQCKRVHINKLCLEGWTRPVKKQTFIQGAMILMAAGIINRILGFVPRMILPRVIGAEGVGLYQMGYPLMIVLITFITGGIPLAVSKLVAEAESEGNEHKVRSILRLALALSSVLGLTFTIGSVAAASWITQHVFTDGRVYTIFLVMSPIIFIVSLSAVYRGYFQGRQNMIPTALSQTVETIIRSIAVLGFAYMLLPHGLEYAAAGAMAGVLVGELGGLLVLYLSHLKSKRKYTYVHKAAIGGSGAATQRRRIQLKRFLRITIPVTASKLVGSASYFLESIMIVQSLAVIGVASQVATAQYGALQGMIIPILLLPTALTYSLSVSLIPSLSEAAARNDRRTIHKRLHQALRLALVSGAPFAVIMYVWAEPICYFLYRDISVAPMLRLMAPVAMFVYLQAPFQAALQALDRPGTALLNTFVGASIKLILIYLLAAKSGLGIQGAVLAINVNIVLVTVMHWQSVRRLLGFSMKLIDFLKVGTGAAVLTMLCYMAVERSLLDSLLGFLLSGLGGATAYLLCCIWLKLVDAEDLKRIPWIGSLLKRKS